MWDQGTLRIKDRNFTYEVKHYEEPSEYGISHGRISKLEIRLDGDAVMFRYDRGWDITTEDEDAKAALTFILQKYN